MPDIRAASAGFLATSLAQLASGSGSDAGAAESIAARIEEAVFARYKGDTGNAYRETMRTLALDLSKNNPELGRSVLSGEVQPEGVVNMDSEDLKSDARAHADDALREQGLRDAMGSEKVPMYAADNVDESAASAANRLPLEGEMSAQQESMGEEGDFKQRMQPKIVGLEGIEFESGL